MLQAIKDFAKQFAFPSPVENSDGLEKYQKFIVAGMGGSHLAADLIKIFNPALDLIIHSDYGLPGISHDRLKETLIVASSYSGNTEETLDAFREARKVGLPLAVISAGGKLLDLAQKYHTPYVQFPDAKIQPRLAVGFSLKALLKIMGQDAAFKNAGDLSETLDASSYEEEGRQLALRLKGFAPIIYSSSKNWSVAYSWKIKFNETGKIPAFCNVLPELNHNEINGFDVKDTTKILAKNFYFIFLKDSDDDSRVQKRMEILGKMYKDRGLPVKTIELTGKNIFLKVFSSLVLADWASYYTAKQYGLDPEPVPMVEEFKKLIS